jgi:hypothetical protein
VPEGAEPLFKKKIFYLGTVNFKKKLYLINHVSTETLTSGWAILSGINSPAAAINCQSTYISYINIHLEKKILI